MTWFEKIAKSALLGRHYGFLTMNQKGKVDFFESLPHRLSGSEVKKTIRRWSYETPLSKCSKKQIVTRNFWHQTIS